MPLPPEDEAAEPPGREEFWFGAMQRWLGIVGTADPPADAPEPAPASPAERPDLTVWWLIG